MKRTYVKPITEVVDMELMNMLAISNGKPTIRVSHSTEADDELANERRGGWGDLWVE